LEYTKITSKTLTHIVFSALRERKEAIAKLFDVVALRPQAGASVKGKDTRAKVQNEARQRMVKHSGEKVKEIVGDGEEIEVDGAEELSKSEIDAIYNKLTLSFD